MCSSVILASIATLSKCIPRKVMAVDGPSILDDITGAQLPLGIKIVATNR